MRVRKRDKSYECISFDKVLKRVQKLSVDLRGVHADEIAQKVCARIYDGVTTSELDELAAQMCATLVTTHPDYGTLAARIIVSNHHKNTSPSFSETVGIMYHATDVHGNKNSLISEELWAIVQAHKEKLNSYIDYRRDYSFDYFGFKTLERGYLTKVDDKIVERPQHLWMRVALGIHGWDVKEALETYDLMSQRYFTHATPTLFNAGCPRAQMSSCYLLMMHDDSIHGIYKTLGDCAQISKYAGGIGLHIHNVRGRGSRIRGTNGTSTGIIPMLRVFNDTARYVNQCMSGDTIVYSKYGPRRMEDVIEGEQLVTIDGSFKRVLGVKRSHVSKDVLKIRPTHSIEPVVVTKEHDIYAIQGAPKMMAYEVIRQKLSDGKVAPSFVQASELKTGDFVGFPIPSYVEDHETKDEDFFRMLGIILGDGHASKRKNTQCVEFGVCLGTGKKMDVFGFVCSFLTSRGIHYWTSTDDIKHTISVRWTQNPLLLDISYDDIYNDQHDKVIPFKYLHLPHSKTMALLQGLFETDGSCVGEIYYHTTSKDLCYNVRYMLMRMGILCSGHIKKESANIQRFRNGVPYTIKSTKPLYVMRIPKHPKLRSIFGDQIVYSTKIKYFVHNNMLWTRIRDIDIEAFDGYVYDFNMEDNHNYTTDMGLVHNSGRRNGSIAVYMEPWHVDIEPFLDIRKNQGAEEERCRDLFTAMWIPDLFMKRVQANADWSLMCPDECPGLSDVYGEEFERLYERYESEGRYRKKVKAQNVWIAIIKSQIESGTPYLCYKDASNQKSNQKNIGTIKSSNLCVAPETKILTRNGYVAIRDLENNNVEIWNGMEWSEVTVRRTSERSELIRVNFDDGSFLECTPYHKFHIQTGVVKDATDLETGDKLIKWSPPSAEESVVETVVKSIERHGRYDATFCFNEPKRHLGIFNGVIAGNCTEITLVSTPDETAVCNLGSIALKAFVEINDDAPPKFNHNKLHRIAQVLTRNINKVIDRNYYPTIETKQSNFRHRPIGLGVQGLADVYALMRVPFDSPDAAKINREIFETIYHGALTASMEIAKKRSMLRDELDNATTSEERRQEIERYLSMTPEEEALTEYRGGYSTFKGSPASEGYLQFDLWGAKPEGNWDWVSLKESIRCYGLRNSMLVAPMPTASTSQILQSTECFEPVTSNIFQRQTLAGEFTIINKHLVWDLIKLGLWSVDMKNRILAGGGSIQHIQEIPEDIRGLYKTAWELKQKVLIDQAADRGIYVCQSQSLNLFMEEPNISRISNMHMYAWSKGLKTGIYYLRTRPKAKITAFTLDPSVKGQPAGETADEPVFVCRRDDPTCTMCSA